MGRPDSPAFHTDTGHVTRLLDRRSNEGVSESDSYFPGILMQQ
jgi:hypothetical protein